MKSLLIFLSLSLTVLLGACGQQVGPSAAPGVRSAATGQQASAAPHPAGYADSIPKTYTRADSLCIVGLLGEASRLKEKPASWMVYFGRKFIGRPYVGGTLDQTSDETLVVNTRQLDCTTLVELVLALSVTASRGETTFDRFIAHLLDVRYVGGRMAYTNRQHYFTLWIEDNVRQGLVSDIQSPSPPFTALQTVHADYMSTHTSSYRMLTAHPEWLPGIRAMERGISGKRYRYIPKAAIDGSALMRRTIHDGDIIAIITSRRGLDTSHIGIAVWHRDGLHMLNASSIHHKVVEEPMLLRDYMRRHPSQLGIRIARPTLQQAF